MIDLITGHQGMAHITAEQISDINNAMMDGYGVDKVMRLDGGDVTLDGLSLIIEVGYWRVNGFDMEIKEEETLYFDPTVAGVSRIDDVYVEILQDITDGYQRAVLVIVQGEPDVSPVAPDEPTIPELNTDILLQIVHVARCTISSGAMTVSDKTIVYKYVSPEDLTSITIKGSTNNTGSTIASGTYFYLNGDLVKAKTSIANGATLTLNTNYVVTAGGLNELNNEISALNSALTNFYYTVTNSDSNTIDKGNYIRVRCTMPASGKYEFVSVRDWKASDWTVILQKVEPKFNESGLFAVDFYFYKMESGSATVTCEATVLVCKKGHFLT